MSGNVCYALAVLPLATDHLRSPTSPHPKMMTFCNSQRIPSPFRDVIERVYLNGLPSFEKLILTP